MSTLGCLAKWRSRSAAQTVGAAAERPVLFDSLLDVFVSAGWAEVARRDMLLFATAHPSAAIAWIRPQAASGIDSRDVGWPECTSLIRTMLPGMTRLM